MGVYRDSLIVFGGFDGSRNNSIYSMHIPTSHWSLVLPAVGSSVPLPRSHHCLAITGNLMYIFGGLSEEAKLLNDLHVFDLERLVWKSLQPEGNAPCGRINHSAHILGNFFVVFGGYDGKLRLNDIIFLNLDTIYWTNPLIHGLPPSRRLGHASVVSGDKLLIFGGDDGNKERELLNDLHIFDLPSMRWYMPELSGCAPPQGRTHASFCITSEDQIWLIDGSNSQKVKLDEIYRFDLAPLHLFQKMLIDRASTSILRDLTDAVYKLQVRASLSTHLSSKRSESSKKRNTGPNAVSANSSNDPPNSSAIPTGLVSPGSPLEDEGSPLVFHDGSAFNAASSASSSSKKSKPKKSDRSVSSEPRGALAGSVTTNLVASSSSGALSSSLGPEHAGSLEDTGASTRAGARSPKKRRHKTVGRSTSTKHDSSPMPISSAHSGGPTSPIEMSPTTSPRSTAKEEIPIWTYTSSGGTTVSAEDDDRTSDEANTGTMNAYNGSGASVTFGGSTSLTFGPGTGLSLHMGASGDFANFDMVLGEEVEHPIVARARRTLRALQHSFHELSLEKEEFMRHKQERLAILAEAGDRDTTQGQELNRLFQQQKTKVILNVGGSMFTTSVTTLTRYPESMLATMFSGRHTLFPEEDGTYFIDRDGTYFRYILNYLRCGADVVLEAKPSVLSELLAEARFYQLEGLKDAIQAILSDPHLVEEPIVEY
jgi:hypothetical protein